MLLLFPPKIVFESSLEFRAKWKGRFRLPTYPLAPHTHSLPTTNVPHQSCAPVSAPEPEPARCYHSRPVPDSRAHSWRCTFFGLHKCVTNGMCLSPCILQSSLTALKTLLLHVSIPPPPQPLATTDLFTVSIVFPFPASHGAGTVQYVGFGDWFLSLSNMRPSFLQVFLCFHSSFLFGTEYHPLSE